jgi:hypothetical protein
MHALEFMLCSREHSYFTYILLGGCVKGLCWNGFLPYTKQKSPAFGAAAS